MSIFNFLQGCRESQEQAPVVSVAVAARPDVALAPTLLNGGRLLQRGEGEMLKAEPVATQQAPPTPPAQLALPTPPPARPLASRGRRQRSDPCCDLGGGLTLADLPRVLGVAVGSPSYEVLDKELAKLGHGRS
mmetsp:Transcript_19632/g.52096  ORF Transcript_19632/g.52096 Transcript_19632/m.52096 type:complete len:133 (-) Transcript_19632:264-662(-)